MDWIRFLDENNIGYVTRGPNTKKGEISIKCPMCEDDPSEHLGVSLTTENWGCHRNSNHRGKSARTLVKALIGCSSGQAGLVVRQYSKADPDTLDAALAVLTDGDKSDFSEMIKNQKSEPKFADFSKIKPRGITKRFFTYLQNRNYSNPDEVISRYSLRCALTGKYKDRIIIPVFMNGEVLGWTSRALGAPLNAPRYLASNEDIKTSILNYDELKKGGWRLFVVEGPFDAITIDSFGMEQGGDVRATCTFGTSVTISQIALLRALGKKFKEVFVLFDKGAEEQGANLASWLSAKQAFLPVGIDDPGELGPQNLASLMREPYDGVARWLWTYPSPFARRSRP